MPKEHTALKGLNFQQTVSNRLYKSQINRQNLHVIERYLHMSRAIELRQRQRS